MKPYLSKNIGHTPPSNQGVIEPSAVVVPSAVSMLKYKLLALSNELFWKFLVLFNVSEINFPVAFIRENSDYLVNLPVTFTQMIKLKQKSNLRIRIRGVRGG